MDHSLDVLLDLTSSPEGPDLIARVIASLHSRLSSVVRSAVVLTPAATGAISVCEECDWRITRTANPILEANQALQHASLDGRHLLVLFGPVLPDCQTLRVLTRGFDLDPYFGITIPRQVDQKTGDTLRLDCKSCHPALPTLSHRITAECPDYWILPDLVCSCFLVRNSLIANFDLLDETYNTLVGALYDYVGRVRRCGFRCVVMNRAVAVVPAGKICCQVPPPISDTLRLYTEHPDNGQARTELALHPCHTYENLLGTAFSGVPAVRQSLLIDARGLPIRMDGTAEAVLSICDALHGFSREWNIAVLADRGPTEFHALRQRYAKWEIIEEPTDCYFTAAVRLSQPWDMQSVLDLHRMALFNFYMMLDTIVWDILFAAPRGLGATWRFVSAHADGILYISEFTRERFMVRFPSACTVSSYVSHLSFRPSDYRNPMCQDQSIHDGEYLFVVGNSYDHKNVGPTVDFLSSAFPFCAIKALGLTSHTNPLVEAIESGHVSQNQIDGLFAQAKIVIFPSFYEGFGFPILKALSSGRTVVARHSSLLLEIASHYRGPGRLIGFRDRIELVDRVGAILHGAGVSGIPLGAALHDDAEPKGWREVSTDVLDFIERQVEHSMKSRWLRRQNAIEQVSAGDVKPVS